MLGGIEAVHYTREVGPSGDDYTGLLSLLAGLLLIGVGALTLWRSRRRDDRLWWRYGRRTLLVVGAAVVAMVVLFPVAIAYVVTHAARADVPAADLGAPFEAVQFTTERRAAAEGLVCPVEERRGGHLVPGAGELAEAGETACAARVRRAALRPPRRRRERRRPESLRLAGRARRPCGRRVPARAPRRRSGADRRHRPLGRRRDDDRGGSRVDGAQGDRLGGRQRTLRSRHRREPGHDLAGRPRQRRRDGRDGCLHQQPAPGRPEEPRAQDLGGRVLRLRGARPASRGAGQQGVLRGGARAEGALGGPGLRAHRRHRGAASGVRASRRRVLRPLRSSGTT